MDAVNPQHYKRGKIECIDGIESALSREEFIGYLRGNVLKYTWRCRYKGGKEDIAKAVWYSNKLIDTLTHDKEIPIRKPQGRSKQASSKGVE